MAIKSCGDSEKKVKLVCNDLATNFGDVLIGSEFFLVSDLG